MSKLLRRIGYWLHRGKRDAELAEEMEFHRAMLAVDGAPRAAMGNTTLAREYARSVWIWPWLESLWQDLAYGGRTLRREPGFTLTALLALGSAIGLNTSMFTIFNAFALRPWAVRNPAEMVTVHRFAREGGGDFGIAEYRYAAQHSKAFSGLIAMRNGERVKMDDRPHQLTYVSGNYFRVLGVGMERGRGFLDDEDRSAAPQGVIVISHDLWQNELGGDPRIVGRSIRLDDIPVTVVGVAPADFTGTNTFRNDIWMPLSAKMLMRPNDPTVQGWLTAPDFCCTPIAGRLAAGVTRKQAQAELAVLLDQFRTANRMREQRARIALAGTAWMDSPRKKGQVVSTMVLLFVAVTLVLLLACANVGNLLLARAAARRQEIAVRLSLGSGRLRIIRQLLVESMLLALGAAAIGVGMALTVPAAVVRRLAEDQAVPATVDWTVLAYTGAVAVLSCLAFGLAPALHGTRTGISASLKAGAPVTAGAQAARLPLRSVLLSIQVAISVICW
jgi:predicted permease